MKLKTIVKQAHSFLPAYSIRKIRRLLRKGEIGIREVEYVGLPITREDVGILSNLRKMK